MSSTAPRPTPRQLLAEAKAAHNHPVYAKMAFVMGCGIQATGSGSRVADETGRHYLALFDQYGNQSFGYSHERLVAALRDQLDTGRLNSTKIMFEPEQIRLTERLSALTGGRLPYAYLANSGGESIDNALKLARAATRRPKFIAATDCFHGKTFATLSASARPEHVDVFQPLIADFRQVPFGDLEALEREIDGDTAAVLLEPVQAEGGVIVPSADYLREVRRLCDAHGALLILDEMQTAFGRCGSFFAFEQFDVLPDLVCIGKAFGGGMLPISAVLGTEKVWECLKVLPSTFGSSLGGNPLSCRIGLETLDLASDPEFLARVRATGAVIGTRLAELAAGYPGLIREHRGIGMMHGLEFLDTATAGLVLGLLHARGVTSTYSLYNPRVLRVQPPMVITPEELEHGLGVLADVLEAASRPTPRTGAPQRPVRVSLEVASDAGHVRALLERYPHLLDPFARDPEQPARLDGAGEPFAGVLGTQTVAWRDHVARTVDGLRLQAEPDWLWTRLERSVSVRADHTGASSRIDIEIDWETGTGSYEDLIGGYIAHFVAQRLQEAAGRLTELALALA